MKSFFTLLSLLLFATLSFAQPSNDNCSGAIALGAIPTCPTQVYSNIGATASTIGTANSPTCFNGGITQRDVWFTFTTTTAVTNSTLVVRGATNGPNAKGLLNPQIAVYRGSCTNNGLSQIACVSATNGTNQVTLDLQNLTPNITYFIRINDYSPTATPNAGDFSVCLQPFAPTFNMGDVPGATTCFGKLFDSGGPDGDYGIFEEETFTICPTDPHACIDIELVNYDVEPILLGFFGDALTFYAGENDRAPVISRVYGQDLGRPFHIQAASRCITVKFESDFLGNYAGFELNWQCSTSPCNNRSFDNPTEIPSLPFDVTGLTTCESASTFADSPCGGDDFLNGPEYVFTYNSLGGTCISVELTNELPETGIVILDGLPGAATTNCVARSSTGMINSANLSVAGTYYIVVANASGCGSFDILVKETTCAISPALVSALCNPLNGCVRLDGLPTIFDFEDGFQDMQIERNVNNGCWLGYGVEPNFYWFTVQAQADGKFGFILDSANPNVPSDLDFNVWGPFSQDEVCGSAQSVIQFIRTNQPIRSSWSPASGPTGLTDRHPRTGAPVTDTYDCGDQPGADGDDYVSTIRVKKDEVYVVLINDWENLIGDEGVGINWSPSDRPVLEQIPAEVVAGDTAVCKGSAVQIRIESPVNTIRWLNDTTTLSCKTCPNPIATPTKTTTYRALVDAVCYNDTIDVTVQVYDVNAGADVTSCLGEQFEIAAGGNFTTATYQWTVPTGIQLSCTNCPNPIVTTANAGTFDVIVQLAAPACTLRDTIRITVLNQPAPPYTISRDTAICQGTAIDIGGLATPGVVYTWTSNPAGFTSTSANPRVTPTQTTTYIFNARNALCPVASVDSVVVTVFEPPVLNVAADTAVCQEQPIRLGNTIPQVGVDYTWFGADFIEDKDNPNTLAFPTQSGLYILIATSGEGICEIRDTVDVRITPIDVEIKAEDTIRICRGTPLTLEVTATPATASVIWTPNDGSLSDTIGYTIIVNPIKTTTYIATVTVDACVRKDTVVVVVDSLPANLAILPGDTSICMGSQVILESEIFEPKDFPNIKFLWEPARGQLTPDSLYNMVIQGDTTTRFYRISTSGVCLDTAFADVMVKPIPVVTIIPSDTTVCAGRPVKLTTTVTPSNFEKPMWEPATGLSCTTCLDPIATVTASTTYTFKVEIDGCPGSSSARIEVLPAPIIQLNPQTTICLGDSIQLNLNATPGATYTWTSPDDPNFSSTNPRLVVRPTRTTTYRVRAQNGGCAAPEGQITITVVQPATLTVSPDQTICAGGSVTLTADGSAPNGVAETFVWTANGIRYNGATVTANNITSNTDFIVTYTYGRNCGTVTDTVRVNILDMGKLVVAPSDTTVCANQPVQLSLQISGQTNNIRWTGEGLSCTDCPNPIARPTSDSSIYNVSVVLASCPDTLKARAIIRTIKLPILELASDTICRGTTVELNLDFTPGATYTWTSPTDPNYRSNSPIPVVSPSQTTTYRVSATNRSCGPVTGEVTITVVPPAEVTITAPDTACVGQRLTLSADGNAPTGLQESFTWRRTVGGQTFSGATLEIEEASVTDSSFILTYSNGGCSTQQNVKIKVQNCEVKVPNAFTPNNDGTNDFFDIVLAAGTPKNIVEFRVFNRWGQLVYDNENKQQGWDGTHNGKEAPSDVYVFFIVVNLEGGNQVFKGDLTLIR